MDLNDIKLCFWEEVARTRGLANDLLFGMVPGKRRREDQNNGK